MVNYQPVSGMLAAMSYEFEGDEVLYGLTMDLNVIAAGSHMLFPYSIGGSSYSTFSAINPRSPGNIQYSGILLGDTTVLRTTVFAQLGLVQTSVRMKVIIPDTNETLAHWEVRDFRIGALKFSTMTMGNSTVVSGTVIITFRRLVNLPF